MTSRNIEGASARNLDPAAERARLAAAHADKAEIELHIMRGELILAEDVERIVGSIVLAARSHLLAVPERASPILASKKHTQEEIADVLHKEIERALRDLSVDPQSVREKCTEDKGPTARPLRPSTKNKGERMGGK